MRYTLNYLLNSGFIKKEDSEKLNTAHLNKPFSIYWHVRLVLYLGVTLLSGGLGTIIYKNIDSIGHITIVTLIGLLSLSALLYCYKKAPLFSVEKTEAPNPWLDYILLLGVTSFLTFEGYLQYQYDIFGTRYGLATIIPALFLFYLSYRFDHLGVLTMAITLFASWMGIAFTPKELMAANDFSELSLVSTGLSLSALLAVTGYFHSQKNIKAHFTFTYYNFALHLGAIATWGATVSFDYGWVWMALLIPIVGLGYLYSMKENSFYFLLISAIYGYIGVSYWFVQVLVLTDELFMMYLLFFYFIVSAVFGLRFLRKAHKKMTAL
ncbi:MAG TPA: DUF2157 domain-containing protein [Fulvivirga sp.]|nr:DUF2157 domain-containing protein [Fulvivirga sp.]